MWKVRESSGFERKTSSPRFIETKSAKIIVVAVSHRDPVGRDNRRRREVHDPVTGPFRALHKSFVRQTGETARRRRLRNNRDAPACECTDVSALHQRLITGDTPAPRFHLAKNRDVSLTLSPRERKLILTANPRSRRKFQIKPPSRSTKSVPFQTRVPNRIRFTFRVEFHESTLIPRELNLQRIEFLVLIMHSIPCALNYMCFRHDNEE